MIKPKLERKSILEQNIIKNGKELQELSQEYYKNLSIYEEYINKQKEIDLYKSFIDNIDNKLELLEFIIIKFSNYRSWMYKEKILPLILNYSNNIIASITDKCLTLDADINEKDCTIQWYFNDNTNRPIIEKASGFQKFILGISIRIALANLGGMNCNQLFIDEGFVACDAEHLSKVPNFLNNLLSLYNNIILVSHLESIKEMNALKINIIRHNDLSKIQFD